MKKLLFFLGVVFCFPLKAVEYTVVIPVAYDKEKKTWNVLLGLDSNKTWTYFGDVLVKNKGPANIQAEHILALQTNNEYSSSFAKVPWKKVMVQDDAYFVHLVPVNYISGKELYTKARNKFRTNFAWEPVAILLSSSVIKHTVSSTLNKIFLQLFRQIWQEKSSELTLFPQPTESQYYTKDGIRITWGAASNGSWVYFFDDTVYANKPNTKGIGVHPIKNKNYAVDFGVYYCFMNTYPEGATGNSNSGPAPITLGLYYAKGLIDKPFYTWKHLESYYQAMKKVYNDCTYDKDSLNDVLQWDQGGDIMQIYNAYKGKVQGLRSDWQAINLYIMLDAVRAKFMQNQNMKNILLKTGDKFIVEETTDRSDVSKDSFFGNEVGHYDAQQKRWITDITKQPGMGSNILGQILMHVRKELQVGMLLPLTLYELPEDFFRAQKNITTGFRGKLWHYAAEHSSLTMNDIPLLSQTTDRSSTLAKSLNGFTQNLNYLSQVLR